MLLAIAGLIWDDGSGSVTAIPGSETVRSIGDSVEVDGAPLQTELPGDASDEATAAEAEANRARTMTAEMEQKIQDTASISARAATAAAAAEIAAEIAADEQAEQQETAAEQEPQELQQATEKEDDEPAADNNQDIEYLKTQADGVAGMQKLHGETALMKAVQRERLLPERWSTEHYGPVSVVATNYSWGKFLSVHDPEWRSGGLDVCEDDQKECGPWAKQGECENNPAYLHQHCPKSCNMCRSALPMAERCQRHPDEQPIYAAPGGLNAMFERLTTNPAIIAKHEPVVHSTDPWVVTLENMVNESEADAIFLSLKNRFEGSTVVGGKTADGLIARQTLQTRTSTNAWCNLAPCMRHDVHMDLQKRIADLTLTDPQHMENLQVLDYDVGQFYNAHHDTISDHIRMMCGPRMLTAFIYFSTAGPNDGGATNFPKLGIKVSPKMGRMVLWPSMLDENSEKIDHRTQHEAMNVTGKEWGKKRAANLWIHQYDYKTANGLGCTGS